MLAQKFQTTRNASNCKTKVPSSVSALVFAGCPSDVSGLIAFGVVLSLKCQSGRSLTKILKKILKCEPPIADRDTSAAIMFELRLPFIGAPSNHIEPTSPGSRWSQLCAVAMPRDSIGGNFTSQTPARICLEAFQRAVQDLDGFPAVALAKTSQVKLSTRRMVRIPLHNYFQSSKRESDQRDFGRHDVGMINVMFSGGRPASTGAHCDYK